MTATSTLTLSAFLLARYDEWEAIAREAGVEEWWLLSANTPPFRKGDREPKWIVDSGPRLISYEVTTMEAGDHIALNDPAFVLAQVASLRAVVELHESVEWGGHWRCGLCGSFGIFETARLEYPCPTLLALAQPFRDHHDMRAEWVTG